MAIWMVRSGKEGELEAASLNNSVCAIGWPDLPDLSLIEDREGLKALIRKLNPDINIPSLNNVASPIHSFVTKINIGDFVLMPRKTKRGYVAVGEVLSAYEFNIKLDPSVRHVRKVKWLTQELSTVEFGEPLQKALKAFAAVYEILVPEAESQIRNVLQKQALNVP